MGTTSREVLERTHRVARLGHWTADRASGAIHCSARALDIHRLGEGETTLTVDDIVGTLTASGRSELAGKVAALFKGGTGFEFEGILATAGRDETRIRIHAEADRDDNGQICGMFAVSQEVGGETVGAAEGEKHEGQLRAMLEALDSAGIGIGTQDADGHILSAGPALLEMTGFTDEAQVRGRRWSEIQTGLGGDHAQMYEAQLASLRAGASSILAFDEVAWHRVDGTVGYYHARTAPLADGRRVLIVLDIADRVRDRQTLAEREAFSQTVLEVIDKAGIGMVIEDHDFRIRKVSSSALSLSGFATEEELVGKLWTDAASRPEDRDHIFAITRDEIVAYAKGKPEPFYYPELAWHRPDGREVIVNIRTSPLPGVGRLVILTDMTQQRELERRQNTTEQALHQAQKMEALGQLAGGVAHELNNMLHPILTFARALRPELRSEAALGYLDHIETSARRAAEVVRNTLTFARPTEGDLVELDLYREATKVIAFSRKVMPPSVALEFEAAVMSAPVMANQTEFSQVMINLIKNASDAMHQRGIVRLNLERRSLPDDGRLPLNAGEYAILSITDHGEGMDEATQARMFEPFFTTKPSGEGTGLGLSVVYGIVSRWHGTIDVDSQAGRGTRVSIYLPLATTHSAA